MKQKIKSASIYLPKIIIFCLALYNFVSIWFEAKLSEGIAGLVDPWYKPWSYYNEPSLLLYATVFLLFKNRGSNLVSITLSGYVFAKAVYLISTIDWLYWLQSIPKQWQFVKEYDIDVSKEWEVQIIFAIIVLGFSIFYFFRNTPKRNLR